MKKHLITLFFAFGALFTTSEVLAQSVPHSLGDDFRLTLIGRQATFVTSTFGLVATSGTWVSAFPPTGIIINDSRYNESWLLPVTTNVDTYIRELNDSNGRIKYFYNSQRVFGSMQMGGRSDNEFEVLVHEVTVDIITDTTVLVSVVEVMDFIRRDYRQSLSLSIAPIGVIERYLGDDLIGLDTAILNCLNILSHAFFGNKQIVSSRPNEDLRECESSYKDAVVHNRDQVIWQEMLTQFEFALVASLGRGIIPYKVSFLQDYAKGIRGQIAWWKTSTTGVGLPPRLKYYSGRDGFTMDKVVAYLKQKDYDMNLPEPTTQNFTTIINDAIQFNGG